MTHGGQCHMSTHSNKSPEWLRLPKNIKNLNLYNACNIPIYIFSYVVYCSEMCDNKN